MASEREALERLIGPDRLLVSVQMALLSVVALGALAEPLLTGNGFTLGSVWISVAAGLVFALAGAAVALIAKRDLARNFSISPTPVTDGRLVDTGIYARMRHPMYLGVLLMLLGWAVLWGSWFGLAGTIAAALFFTLKARHEERLLERRYPDYAAYRTRVRGGILPRL